MTMQPVALPAFTDNYIWLLHDGANAVVVDPGDSRPVRQALQARGLELQAILLTHHHADHVGGVMDLVQQYRPTVYGPAHERLPVPVVSLAEGDAVELLGLRLCVLDVPGHTAGHIAYLQDTAHSPLLFCGDTLFSAGCGRLFEGTPAQMHASLQRLAALPPDTQVCCAHEYTLANLRFAASVEPMNDEVTQHRAWCEARRAAGLPTLPSTIALERRINPFLRVHEPTVVDAARASGATADTGVEVFAALRRWKDRF